jgi:hypothetical protein
MSIKVRIIKILISPFPVLNDLDLKINRGLFLFITNPFMKYHNVLKILNRYHLVYRPTSAKQYPPLLRRGHNVKTGTQFFCIQNFNEIKTNMQLCNVKQIKLKTKNAMETTKYKVNSIVKRK